MILYEPGKIKEAEEKLAAGKKLMESSDLIEKLKKRLWRSYLSHSTRLAVLKGNIDQAKEYAQKYKKIAEKKAIPYQIKWCFTLSGLIANAEGHYEKAIADLNQSNLDSPFNNYHLALAYIKSGDKPKAIEKLESVVNYSGGLSFRRVMVLGRAEKQLARLRVDD
jgi:tetratricopeptide (TPR) repeat protein